MPRNIPVVIAASTIDKTNASNDVHPNPVRHFKLEAIFSPQYAVPNAQAKLRALRILAR